MNVRFDSDTKETLVSLSTDFNFTVSDIIRQAVLQKISEWRQNGRIIISRDTVARLG